MFISQALAPATLSVMYVASPDTVSVPRVELMAIVVVTALAPVPTVTSTEVPLRLVFEAAKPALLRSELWARLVTETWWVPGVAAPVIVAVTPVGMLELAVRIRRIPHEKTHKSHPREFRMLGEKLELIRGCR